MHAYCNDNYHYCTHELLLKNSWSDKKKHKMCFYGVTPSAGKSSSVSAGQLLCPFKSSFWSDILQIGLDNNLLSDNTLKKITHDVLVRCLVIVSDRNAKLAGHFQNLVGQCLVTNRYFQHWTTEVIRYENQPLTKYPLDELMLITNGDYYYYYYYYYCYS